MTDETYDRVTGEIVSDETRVPNTLRRLENDGVPVPKQSRDAAGILAMLESGEFNREVGDDIRELVQAMEAHAHNNKGTAKGKVTITLDLSVANGIFVVTGSHAIKKPVAKRLGTALFAREDGGLGINPAGKYRSLGHQHDVREVEIVQDERDMREDRDYGNARDV